MLKKTISSLSPSPKLGESNEGNPSFDVERVLYEDDNCLVIDKPAGIMVHPVGPPPSLPPQGGGIEADEFSSSPNLGEGGGEAEPGEVSGAAEGATISDWMGEKYPESKQIDIERPGIVHRLDRDTSGCLLLIKDPKSFTKYKAQFQEHKIKKVYYAIVSGNIKDDTGIIDSPIARTRSDFRKKGVQDEFSKDYRGELRDAITRYKVIERIKSVKGESYTLIECLPLTGRTHQIRVHLRSIRHPIIGDQLYGSRDGARLANRQMLHAKSLEFNTFIRNERGDYKSKAIKVESPMPEDMVKTLEKLRQMC